MASTLLLAAACKEESAPIGPEPGSGGSGAASGSGGSGAGTGSGGKSPGTACPASAKGATMVLVTTDQGESYCIDQREVLQSEYLAFAEAKGSDMSGQPPECADNEAYLPALPGNHTEAPQPGTCHKDYWQGNPDRPMVCVDFCDAAAYCKWAGKRLCGSLDAPADAVLKLKQAELESLMKSTRHEWTHACTQGGKTAWPYGDDYEAAKCIDKARFDAEGWPSVRAANLDGETCHGAQEPYSDIYHLSGSVAEWVNVCDEAGSYCVVQGGSAGMDLEYFPCAQAVTPFRGAIAPDYGIRCCADL